MISFVLNLWLVLFSPAARVVDASDWIDYPNNGEATMTHYDLPKDYIASCGCVGGSTKYPTVTVLCTRDSTGDRMTPRSYPMQDLWSISQTVAFLETRNEKEYGIKMARSYGMRFI